MTTEERTAFQKLWRMLDNPLLSVIARPCRKVGHASNHHVLGDIGRVCYIEDAEVG